MRSSTAFLLAGAVAVSFAGCAKKSQQTEAVKVDNPPEAAAPATQTAPPPLPPGPAPEAALKPKPDAKGFAKTASGLMYKDIKVGSGQAAKVGNAVTVHYKGWLDDGTVFDTSKKPNGGPFTFNLGQGEVIKGWDEGVAGMKPGGVRELKIPPELGYRDQEMGKIPPNSTLHFTVELLSIGG